MMSPPPPRPAREISITAGRTALHDPASYDPGPSTEPDAEPSRLPLYLAAGAAIAFAATLSLLALQFDAPWGLLTATTACASVWAFWRMIDPGARFAGRHRAGNTPAESDLRDIEHLQKVLEHRGTAEVLEFGGSRPTRHTKVGK